jgi:hypothetical protein
MAKLQQLTNVSCNGTFLKHPTVFHLHYFTWQLVILRNSIFKHLSYVLVTQIRCKSKNTAEGHIRHHPKGHGYQFYFVYGCKVKDVFVYILN